MSPCSCLPLLAVMAALYLFLRLLLWLSALREAERADRRPPPDRPS